MSAERPPHTAVVGLGWGDEGKGKIVDLLSPQFDIVVRYNGGANAGHTVCVGDEKFALHLVPSGVLHEGAIGLIGPGVAVDPIGLVSEIEGLEARGVRIGSNLKISDRAHVVAPYHQVEDRLGEEQATNQHRIGTTARGIGPCYADKARRRSAVRMGDLLRLDRLKEKLDRNVARKRRMFQALYGDDGGLDAAKVLDALRAATDKLGPYICDTTVLLREALAADRRLLFEGANGMLLDVDHGTYPYVTSSNTGPWGIAAGAGVPPQTVQRCIGVIKAYATRVGAGPFPSELKDATGDRIREQGHEYGTTTGRPRRCGWFDAVVVRDGVHLGGITEIALMHLDTLGGFDEVGVCTGYLHEGQTIDSLPADIDVCNRLEPVFEMQPGWLDDLRGAPSIDALPAPALGYVRRIEALVGAPVGVVSVGPERNQTLQSEETK